MEAQAHTTPTSHEHAGDTASPDVTVRRISERERRSDVRKPLHARALMCLNGQVVEAKTRDLNQGGVSLLSPLHLTKGMLLHLKFQVRLGMVYHMVEARCEVVHTVVGSGGSGFKVGLIFKQVSATDQNIMSKYLQG